MRISLSSIFLFLLPLSYISTKLKKQKAVPYGDDNIHDAKIVGQKLEFSLKFLVEEISIFKLLKILEYYLAVLSIFIRR